MATFESQNRRMPKIEACLKANGLESLDACNEMLLAKGIDCDKIIRGIQPICFDNAVWAYTLGTAIAVKRGLKSAADCAAAIGEGLEAFTIPGSVAEQRKVGLGTATSALCCCMRTPIASPSWLATSPSPPLRALSALPVPPTRSAKSPCASS